MLGFVLNQDQNGALTSKGCINENLIEVGSNQFHKGFVFGNDVDGTVIYDPEEFGDAEMSEFYIYNRVLTK